MTYLQQIKLHTSMQLPGSLIQLGYPDSYRPPRSCGSRMAVLWAAEERPVGDLGRLVEDFWSRSPRDGGTVVLLEAVVVQGSGHIDGHRGLWVWPESAKSWLFGDEVVSATYISVFKTNLRVPFSRFELDKFDPYSFSTT